MKVKHRTGCCCDDDVDPPSHEITLTVLGCGDMPVPEAEVTLYSDPDRTIIQNFGVTDEDGKITLSYTIPVYYETSHPSGRFALSHFQPTNFQTILLLPAPGFTCCSLPSPYPIPFELKITDQSGTLTLPVRDMLSPCQGWVETTRLMYPVGEEIGPVLGKCDSIPPTYFPPKVTESPANIGYSYGISSVGDDVVAEAGQTTFERIVNANANIGYNPAQTAESLGPCLPKTHNRRWILPLGSGFASDAVTRVSTSFTVNSLMPLNITFHFDPGGSWGPELRGDPIPGSPYATSLVLHE